MFFDEKRQGGIAGAILHSDGNGKLQNGKTPEAAPEASDIRLLAHELLDAIEKRDAQGVADAFRALWCAYEQTEPSEGDE